MKIFDYFSYSLIAAVVVQGLCQVTKLVYYSIRDRSFKLSYLFSAGGMPSSHSAFVTALTTSIALRNGLKSELFAIAFVLSAITVYDAYRLRGTVQAHSKLLQKLKNLLPETKDTEINEMVGHSIPEVVAGIITGLVFAIGVFFLIGK